MGCWALVGIDLKKFNSPLPLSYAGRTTDRLYAATI
jgi:hypothetical protein